MNNETTTIDRRLFLAGSALTLLSASAHAQQEKPAVADTAKPTQLAADFIAGFELKQAPALAVDRARVAFIDTVGVMLAGSRTEPAAIVLEMVKAEGAAPAVSIVGQSLRTSPQLAALANGVASHALDFDLTYTQGQLVASLIPALLPLAESTGATPAETLAAFIAGFEVVSRLSRANPDHNGGGSWHGTGTIGAIGAAAACAQAHQAAGRQDRGGDRHRRVAGLGRQRQLRHHDQAAACRAGGAQRHDGSAGSVRAASPPTPRRSRAATALPAPSRAGSSGSPRRSAISARHSISPSAASGPSAIRAAA